jgi:hypothetical protein
MTMSIWALASGTTGTPTISLEIWRENSSWGSVRHTFDLIQDGAWHQYKYNFTGADQSTDTQLLMLFLKTQNGGAQNGAKIYVDDAFFGPSATTAPGGFRREVLTTLNTLNPGTMRYTIEPALTQTDAYFEGNDYQKGPSSDWSGNIFTWYFSLKDKYAMAGAIGAAPWVSIPDVWNDADVTAFATNLCAAFSTANIIQAFVEQSNEDWISGSQTAGGGDTVKYGAMANRNFAMINEYMASNCASYANKVHFMVGGQEDNYGVLTAASSQLPHNRQYGAAIADYVPDENEQDTGRTMAQYAKLGFENSLIQFQSGSESNDFTDNVPGNLNQLCGGASGCNQFIAFYENGNGNQCGTATPVEAYGMSAGWIAAGFNGQNWILGFLTGSAGPNDGALKPMIAQNAFNFAQLEFTTQNWQYPGGYGTTSALWGLVHDLDANFGPTFPHIRPVGWAMALANRAIGGDYYTIDTVNFPGVYGAAFEVGGKWRALLSNSNSASVSISIAFPSRSLPAAGYTVQYTNSISDNNEDSNSVYIGTLPGGLVASGQTITVTLPPLSLVALR